MLVSWLVIVVTSLTSNAFLCRNNSLELMSRNIKYARTKTAEEIGIKVSSRILVTGQSLDFSSNRIFS